MSQKKKSNLGKQFDFGSYKNENNCKKKKKKTNEEY